MATDEKEKSNLQIDLLFCVFLIALLGVFFVAALGYRPVTRLAPLIVMIPLTVMLVGQAAVLLSKLIKSQPKGIKGMLLPRIERENLQKGAVLLLWMAFLMFLIYLAGQVGGIAIFLILFLILVSHEKWTISIMLGLCIAAALYVVFDVILGIILYPGLIYTRVMALIWA